jgi:hypothetical protein
MEFLQSTIEGRSYQQLQEGETEEDLGPLKYAKSGPMFVRFLRENLPFKNIFESNRIAYEFYDCVRCGLLHEARTKKGWLIRAESTDGNMLKIEGSKRVLYRNDFQRELIQAIEIYRQDLMQRDDLQEKFKRKINGLCIV